VVGVHDHTDSDDTPHGCSVTLSWLIAVVAAPMHRPESTPYGAYSISNAGSSGKAVSRHMPVTALLLPP